MTISIEDAIAWIKLGISNGNTDAAVRLLGDLAPQIRELIKRLDESEAEINRLRSLLGGDNIVGP